MAFILEYAPTISLKEVENFFMPYYYHVKNNPSNDFFTRKRKRIPDESPNNEFKKKKKFFTPNQSVVKYNSSRVVSIRPFQPISKYDAFIGLDSKWANPFSFEGEYCGPNSLWKYKQYILNKPLLFHSLHELRGKILGCDCGRLEYCYGFTLIEILKNMFPDDDYDEII